MVLPASQRQAEANGQQILPSLISNEGEKSTGVGHPKGPLRILHSKRVSTWSSPPALLDLFAVPNSQSRRHLDLPLLIFIFWYTAIGPGRHNTYCAHSFWPADPLIHTTNTTPLSLLYSYVSELFRATRPAQPLFHQSLPHSFSGNEAMLSRNLFKVHLSRCLPSANSRLLALISLLLFSITYKLLNLQPFCFDNDTTVKGGCGGPPVMTAGIPDVWGNWVVYSSGARNGSYATCAALEG